MAKSNKSPAYLNYRVRVGRNLKRIILDKGYKSVYEFWIQECEGISRAHLNKLIDGNADVRLSTLFELSKRLKIGLDELLLLK